MKKNMYISVALWAVCFVFLCGCAVKTEDTPLFPAGEVKTVYVTSLPERNEYEYVLHNRDAAQIVDYLKNLTLISEFEENPDHYNGMAWVIMLVYADGTEHRVVHFGNKFICGEDARWYKMEYEQAAALDSLLGAGD